MSVILKSPFVVICYRGCFQARESSVTWNGELAAGALEGCIGGDGPISAPALQFEDLIFQMLREVFLSFFNALAISPLWFINCISHSFESIYLFLFMFGWTGSWIRHAEPCGTWDLIFQPGLETPGPALGAQRLSPGPPDVPEGFFQNAFGRLLALLPRIFSLYEFFLKNIFIILLFHARVAKASCVCDSLPLQ